MYFAVEFKTANGDRVYGQGNWSFKMLKYLSHEAIIEVLVNQ